MARIYLSTREFPKIRATLFWAPPYNIRILLFRVLIRVPYFRKLHIDDVPGSGLKFLCAYLESVRWFLALPFLLCSRLPSQFWRTVNPAESLNLHIYDLCTHITVSIPLTYAYVCVCVYIYIHIYSHAHQHEAPSV